MQYVQVTGVEDSEPIRISSADDGTLTVSTLAAYYPGATGLKYRLGGNVHTVKLSNGILYPPKNDWGDNVYFCIFSKNFTIKRKAESTSETPKSKISKVDTDSKQMPVISDSPLKNCDYPKFGELPNSQNSKITPKNLESCDFSDCLAGLSIPSGFGNRNDDSSESLTAKESEISIGSNGNDVGNQKNSKITPKNLESCDFSDCLAGLSIPSGFGNRNDDSSESLTAKESEISIGSNGNDVGNQKNSKITPKNLESCDFSDCLAGLSIPSGFGNRNDDSSESLTAKESEISIGSNGNDVGNQKNSKITPTNLESCDFSDCFADLSIPSEVEIYDQKLSVPQFANREISMKLVRDGNNELCVSLSSIEKDDGSLVSEKDILFNLLKKWLQYKYRCTVYIEVFSETLRELSFTHLEEKYRVSMSTGDTVTVVNESQQKVKIMKKKELPVVDDEKHISIENEEEKDTLVAFFRELEY